MLDGSLPHAFPVVLGRKGSGIVEHCGPEARGLAPGDHVVALFVPECGDCENCWSGKTNLCALRMRTEQTHLFRCEQVVPRLSGLGTFSEYAVVRDIALAKVTPAAPFDRTFSTGCGVTTGVGAAAFSAKMEVGSKVVVFGLGGIGLNVLHGARLCGASIIVGVDADPSRESIAREFGAIHFIDSRAIDGDLVSHRNALTGGAGYTFECVGIPALTKPASDAAHPLWGTMTFVGSAPVGQTVPANSFDFLGDRTWRRTLFGGARARTDTPRVVDWYLYLGGKIAINPLVTHRIALNDIDEGFAIMKSGGAVRTVILF